MNCAWYNKPRTRKCEKYDTETIHEIRFNESRSKFTKPCRHSYEINCPVELGRDSNWIDYRYALEECWDVGDDRGGKSNSGGDASFDFRFDRFQESNAWL